MQRKMTFQSQDSTKGSHSLTDLWKPQCPQAEAKWEQKKS